MRVIDLSHPIEEGMPVYPGTEPPQLIPANSYEKDDFRETKLCMYSHTGTHMDAPAHLFAHRPTLDALPASQFIGKALVIDCRGKSAITMAELLPYGGKLKEADFLLFRTGWDQYWGMPEYYGAFPCVDDEVLDFIMAGDYKGVGSDTISLDPVDDLTRHKKLFAVKDMVNVENLTRLGECGDDLFSFSCFPLPTRDADGSPVRAVAWFE